MTIRSTQPKATPMSANGLLARFEALAALTATNSPKAAPPAAAVARTYEITSPMRRPRLRGSCR